MIPLWLLEPSNSAKSKKAKLFLMQVLSGTPACSCPNQLKPIMKVHNKTKETVPQSMTQHMLVAIQVQNTTWEQKDGTD